LSGDGPDLDLDRAGELVAVDTQQLRAGEAAGDPLDVGQHLPCLAGGHGHAKLVD
jgi:hypothetical protein